MKKTRIGKIFTVGIAALLVMAMLTGCGGGMMGYGGYDPDYSGEAAIERDPDNQQGIQAGQLTGAEWNDLKNYGYWRRLISEAEQVPDEQEQQPTDGEDIDAALTSDGEDIDAALTSDGEDDGELRDENGDIIENPKPQDGKFRQFLPLWSESIFRRIPVVVTSGETAAVNAEVKLYSADSQDLLYAAKTNARGEAFLFSGNAAGEYKVTVNGGSATAVTYADDMQPVEIEIAGGESAPSELEIMFVIDTTGSMGDEIAYLKAEIADVINSVTATTGVSVRVALLFYRDTKDTYVTKYHDFNSNITTVQKNLAAASAAGGGDFPEAVDRALSEAAAKQWSSGNVTKLVIHVADAPPHTDDQNKMSVYREAVLSLAEQGIRVIPLASSGIDTRTEFLFRTQAILTGGTYLFLTNHSGIGNPHKDADVPTVVPEYVNAMLKRVISEYVTGVATQPVPYSEQ